MLQRHYLCLLVVDAAIQTVWGDKYTELAKSVTPTQNYLSFHDLFMCVFAQESTMYESK